MDLVEGALRWLGAASAGLVLLIVVWGVVQSHRRPVGRTTGAAERVLRPSVEAAIGVGFFGVCIVLWRALPLRPGGGLLVVVDVGGALLVMAGLSLVLWGRLALGRFYGVSSATGARLLSGHRLITHGPFAHVRHPMYVGIEVAAVGGLLLYRTWTMVFLTIAFVGLAVRAHREDEVLRLEFGDQWEAYRQQVPGWLPRIGGIKRPRPSGLDDAR